MAASLPLGSARTLFAQVQRLASFCLLFMLGLEYTGDELRKSLRLGVTAGGIDFSVEFPPGLAAGFLVPLGPPPAVPLGGVTHIFPSGRTRERLAELRRLGEPKTPLV